MTILIVVLLAIVLVAILVMISSVYQFNRDTHRRFSEMAQKYMALDHKLTALENIVNRMREVEQDERD